MKALEAFIGSIGIALVGWVTIPLAAHLAGVQIGFQQAVTMSAVFFVGRFLWLLALRSIFERVAR